jgi:hypothetical protein
MRGSPSATSTTLVRADAPATRRTSSRLTPNAAATAASAASVALPSTARALTRTTSAPPCSPPTTGCAEPGRTLIVIRTCPVCRTRREFFRASGRATVRLTHCAVVPNSRHRGSVYLCTCVYVAWCQLTRGSGSILAAGTLMAAILQILIFLHSHSIKPIVVRPSCSSPGRSRGTAFQNDPSPARLQRTTRRDLFQYRSIRRLRASPGVADGGPDTVME